MARFVLATLAALSCTLGSPEQMQTGVEPPASQPTSRPAAKPSPRHPLQAQIYQELLRDSERTAAKPILPVDPATGRAPTEPGATGGASPLSEGTVLIERSGRLVRSGDRAEFRFSPGSSPDGAPAAMEILKNGLLELMEGEGEAGVYGFIISAEVTQYRGQNYLLLRKCQRQISHGNLSP